MLSGDDVGILVVIVEDSAGDRLRYSHVPMCNTPVSRSAPHGGVPNKGSFLGTPFQA